MRFPGGREGSESMTMTREEESDGGLLSSCKRKLDETGG